MAGKGTERAHSALFVATAARSEAERDESG